MNEIRNTRQKKIIEGEIERFGTFFSAEELFKRVNARDPKIGIATVYRYLRATGRNGKLHTYNCDRCTIYTINENSHCHFRCNSCGKEYHINVKNIDFLKHGIKGKICHFQLDVYGICEECLNKTIEMDRSY